MWESIEKFENWVDNAPERNLSEMDRDWVWYSLEKDIVNPKEGNEKIYKKLADIHKGMSEDAEVWAATADVQDKLNALKSSLS